MSRRDDRTRRALTDLADEFACIAAGCRDLDRAFNRARASGLALDLELAYRVARDLDRGLAPYLASDRARAHDLVGDLIGDSGRALTVRTNASALERAYARALALDLTLNATSDMLRELGRQRGGGEAGLTWANKTELWVLRCLAWLLPAGERSRFVAEAKGNLGDCDDWWQRVDHLVCLAIGMPRLVAMMWREDRQGCA